MRRHAVTCRPDDCQPELCQCWCCPDLAEEPVKCVGGDHCICDDCMYFLINLADPGRIARAENQADANRIEET